MVGFMEFVHTDEMEVIVAHSGHMSHHRHFLLRYMEHVYSEGVELIMGHVPDYSILRNAPMMSSDPAMIGRIIQMHEDEINSIVDKIKDRLSGHGIRGRLLRLHGEAGHAIVKAAETHRVSCIVTGSRGLGTIRRTMMGSVSDYILHHAHVPVLVCRYRETPQPPRSKTPDPPQQRTKTPNAPRQRARTPDPPQVRVKTPEAPQPRAKTPDAPQRAKTPEAPQPRAKTPEAPQPRAKTQEAPQRAKTPEAPQPRAKTPDAPQRPRTPEAPQPRVKTPEPPQIRVKTPDPPAKGKGEGETEKEQ
ncbi:hypothetical protein ACOMHN_018399 [Nucella lapillus]